MKALTASLALLLAAAGLAVAIQSGESLKHVAESDHLRINAFVDRHYAAYVENYLKVFSGHFRCDYDFIDETEFNDLAEDALRSLAASVRVLLSERMQSTLTAMTSEQLDYTASLVSMSVIDAYAERYTAELGSQYDAGTLDCAEAREENQAIYNSLPASRDAMKGLVIPSE